MNQITAEKLLGSLFDGLQVTVSIGAAMSRIDDTAETVVSRADRLLYLSKSRGQNRVTEDGDNG